MYVYICICTNIEQIQTNISVSDATGDSDTTRGIAIRDSIFQNVKPSWSSANKAKYGFLSIYLADIYLEILDILKAGKKYYFLFICKMKLGS